jgi:hypothetical protein
MYHDLPRSARFWLFLLAVDQELAETIRTQGCSCGGRLHCTNYLRKPRGTPVQLPKEQRLRLSFCCDRDGCRKRVTPPSVRFLGPKVFLGPIVILISAMRQGPTPRRVRELFERFRVTRWTIARWQSSGASSFRKHRSGRSPALGSHRPSQSSACLTRLWMPFSPSIAAVEVGRSSCDFSRRSRFPEPYESRYHNDFHPPAEDAHRLIR